MTSQEFIAFSAHIADLKAQRLRLAVLLDRTEHLQGTRYRESLESDFRELSEQLAAITPDSFGGKLQTGSNGASEGGNKSSP